MDISTGIIGVGFVGSAIQESFLQKNITVKPYDKYKKIGSLEDTITTDIIFLVLPTPFHPELEKYDITETHNICKLLQKHHYKGTVVIKSTVEPGTCEKLGIEYQLNIIHNPEFLTQRTAFQDFHYQKHIVIGSTTPCSSENLIQLRDFYAKYYPDAKISMCNSTESETMKLGCNSFYAVKVSFFNEIYALCHKMNVEYDMVRDMMLANNWINPMHTKVPGTDGKNGFAGACLPKDSLALNSCYLRNDVPNKVLNGAVEDNHFWRPEAYNFKK